MDEINILSWTESKGSERSKHIVHRVQLVAQGILNEALACLSRIVMGEVN